MYADVETDGIVAGVIRDTVYLDGGYLFWEPGMSDGSYGAPTNDGIQQNHFKLEEVAHARRKSIGNCIFVELQHPLQHGAVLQYEHCLRNDI